jgi:integrase-like protein
MTKQITPLRQRMLDDMALRNMSPATQRVYINAVKNFSVFFGRSPDKLTFEDVRTYQLMANERGPLQRARERAPRQLHGDAMLAKPEAVRLA